MKLRTHFLPLGLFLLVFYLPCQAGVIDSLNRLIRQNKADTVQVNILLSLSDANKDLNADLAGKNASDGLKMAQKLGWKRGIARASLALGSVLERQDKNIEAFSVLKQGLEVSRASADHRHEAAILAKTGKVYRNLGQYTNSVETLLSAIKIAQKYGYDVELISAYNVLAGTYVEIRDNANAISYMRKAYSLSMKNSDPQTQSQMILNLGAVYLKMKNLDSALFYINEGLSIGKKTNNKDLKCMALGNLATVYINLKKYDLAKQCTDSALDILKNTDKKSAKSFIWFIRGNVFYLLNRAAEVIPCYDTALKYARAINNIPRQRDILNKKSQVQEQNGKIADAYATYKEFIKVKDSVDKMASRKEITQKEMKFEFDQLQEKEKLAQEKKDLIAAQTLQHSQLQRNGILGGSFLLLLLFGVSVYGYQKERKSKSIIRAEKERSESQSRKLAEVNGVKDKLFSIISHDMRSPLMTLEATLQLVKSDALSQEELPQYITNLDNAFRTTLDLLENLLAWSATQIKESGVRMEIVDLYQESDKAIALVQNFGMAKGLRIENHINPGQTATMDRNVLQLVLRNLLNNAIKFSYPESLITIAGSMENGKPVITVTDNGMGISPEVMKELFTLESSTSLGTNNEKGNGLGLALCKELVEKCGGAIHVKSIQGEGSSFSIYMEK